MLATRIATAAVLVPLVVAGIILLPTRIVAIIFAVLMIIGAWEWARLLGWEKLMPRAAYTVVFAVSAALCYYFGLLTGNVDIAASWLLGVGCAWWLIVVYWLVRYPAVWTETIGRAPAGGIAGLIALCAAIVAIPSIHDGDQGIAVLLIFCILIWGADTGAYFAGRSLGRHKLAPEVSPGKTREGAAGGVAAALIVAIISGLFLGYGGIRLAGFVLLGGWIAIVSMLGDLTLSMFKRHAGIKDSGSLFPGHGGVLDRLDSLLAAAPWFAAGLIWLK